MDIDYQKLLNLAEELTKNGKEWHFHYLPPNCSLGDSLKHLIILESERQKWQTSFKEKPMDDLKKLENLFYKRIS